MIEWPCSQVTSAGEKIDFIFTGTLNAEQQEALEGILDNDVGVFVAPPGMGKTVLAIAAIAKRKTNVLIRLHRYHKDKADIRIYDYVDKSVPVLERMFQRRLKTYKMLGYELKE